jgi:hypothetical protein
MTIILDHQDTSPDSSLNPLYSPLNSDLGSASFSEQGTITHYVLHGEQDSRISASDLESANRSSIMQREISFIPDAPNHAPPLDLAETEPIGAPHLPFQRTLNLIEQLIQEMRLGSSLNPVESEESDCLSSLTVSMLSYSETSHETERDSRSLNSCEMSIRSVSSTSSSCVSSTKDRD